MQKASFATHISRKRTHFEGLLNNNKEYYCPSFARLAQHHAGESWHLNLLNEHGRTAFAGKCSGARSCRLSSYSLVRKRSFSCISLFISVVCDQFSSTAARRKIQARIWRLTCTRVLLDRLLMSPSLAIFEICQEQTNCQSLCQTQISLTNWSKFGKATSQGAFVLATCTAAAERGDSFKGMQSERSHSTFEESFD